MNKLRSKIEALVSRREDSGEVPFPPFFDGQALQDLMSIQARNVEAMGALNDLIVKAAETITMQQVAAAKALTDQFAVGNTTLFGARAPEEWGAAQADLLRTWVDTWFAQAHAVAETSGRCCANAAGIVTKRCAEAVAEAKCMAGGK